MPDVSYSRVNWADSPSTTTPINAENLNKMDKGIADCVTAVNAKQAQTDNNLATESKNIVGAINENKAAIGTINNDLAGKQAALSVVDITPASVTGINNLSARQYGKIIEIDFPNQTITLSANDVICSGLPKPKKDVIIHGSGDYAAIIVLNTNGELYAPSALTSKYFASTLTYITVD